MYKIYITGCARSGTTLLQQMMYAFRNMHIVGPEHFIDGFLKDEIRQLPRHQHVVIKRSRSCLSGIYPAEFTQNDEMSIEDYREQLLQIIQKLNLRLLDIFRDPRDVLTSRHHSDPDSYYVSFERWYGHHCDIQWLQQRWDKFLQVKFENLLRSPNRVQDKISNHFNLKKKAEFSDYPEFIEKSSLPENQRKALKGFRKLDPEKIGRWRETDPEYILELTKNYPQLLDLLIEYDYEPDKSWQEKLIVE